MTTLQSIPDAASPEIVANEVNDTLSAAGMYGKRHPVTLGLTWGYYGGLYNGNTISDGTVTLTNNADNYVVVLRSTGVVSVSTSSTNSVDPLYAKLYKVTTVSGAVTAVVDQRQDANGFLRGEGTGGGGGGGTELKGLTFTSDTGSTADSDPGNGLFKWNNATEASATFLYFDNQTLDGISLTTFFASLGSSGIIFLQQSDDATKWQLWKWTAVTAGSGYYKFAVTLQANGGTIADNKTVYCDFSGLQSVQPPNVQSVASSATVTPTFSNDLVKITAQAAGLTLANPTGTAIDGWGIVIRIKDNGNARSIGYGTQYRAIGVTLPIITVVNKTLYLSMIFNNDDTKWDVVAVGQEA